MQPKKESSYEQPKKPVWLTQAKKPDHNSYFLLEEQMDLAVELYEGDDCPSLQNIADQMNISMNGVSINPIKVRRLLITARVYESEMADHVNLAFQFFRNSGLSYEYSTPVEHPRRVWLNKGIGATYSAE